MHKDTPTNAEQNHEQTPRSRTQKGSDCIAAIRKQIAANKARLAVTPDNFALLVNTDSLTGAIAMLERRRLMKTP